ncbi:hypothetical protein P9390_24900, partial [Escherichia coli]|uniref:hypothetical protein n=1 Tax=Escherichia coli TaxID=562 RepID=UPI0038929922
LRGYLKKIPVLRKKARMLEYPHSKRGELIMQKYLLPAIFVTCRSCGNCLWITGATHINE